MNRLKRGFVIMFDGPDGVGKSTQLELAADALKRQGYKVECLHVLGGTDINEALRRVLFSNYPRPAETDAYIALAMHYSLAERLKKLVSEGVIVLVDRSALSMVAYQVFGGGFDQKLGYQLADKAIKIDKANLIIVYQAPEAVLTSRRAAQAKAKDYFERQNQAFHQRTIEGYKAAAQHYGATVIDGATDITTVHKLTMEAIHRSLTAA
ncbi:MAG TPA: dTMP kinase [Candidatus Saccharimonadales bacterium]|nr:dTMP kinase [Candidatus Saccharimonadales bacterium]